MGGAAKDKADLDVIVKGGAVAARSRLVEPSEIRRARVDDAGTLKKRSEGANDREIEPDGFSEVTHPAGPLQDAQLVQMFGFDMEHRMPEEFRHVREEAVADREGARIARLQRAIQIEFRPDRIAHEAAVGLVLRKMPKVAGPSVGIRADKGTEPGCRGIVLVILPFLERLEPDRLAGHPEKAVIGMEKVSCVPDQVSAGPGCCPIEDKTGVRIANFLDCLLVGSTLLPVCNVVRMEDRIE